MFKINIFSKDYKNENKDRIINETYLTKNS